MGPPGGVQAALGLPVAAKVAVHHRAGDEQFFPEPAARVGRAQEMARVPHPADDLQRQRRLPLDHPHHQSLGHAHDLGVNHQFLQTEATLKVEHAGAGDHVDARQRPQDRADARFEPALGIHHLGVGHSQVGVGGQIKILAHLGVGAINHHRLNSAHRRRAGAHVESGRRAAPDDRCAGLHQLVNGDAAQTLGGVLDD